MADVVTTEDVRHYLNSPPWSAQQEAACALLISRRQGDLRNYFRCPITPEPKIEVVPVLRSGVVATSWPVWSVNAINSVAGVGGDPPAPYKWLEEGWIGIDPPAGVDGYLTRPFSLTVATPAQVLVTVDYLGGWGARPDITGAIIEKVAATMLNRTDDTVVARQMDAKEPPAIKEGWSDDDLKLLRARRRLRVGST